ncbi:hypothetical protein F3Y22_tig00110788pilonHSYRG00091 [Hibiscus syriacus]|uniref:Uncharacterized protein n=1 Tax=Hibiscus syriacus TaxID=106335 RepID=A0A6A2ZQ35_HIBSY|nr:hypothetical protein F3Y22_tig00110788pilonHSYRG00091 [Hibiscus syriacus]
MEKMDWPLHFVTFNLSLNKWFFIRVVFYKEGAMARLPSISIAFQFSGGWHEWVVEQSYSNEFNVVGEASYVVSWVTLGSTEKFCGNVEADISQIPSSARWVEGETFVLRWPITTPLSKEEDLLILNMRCTVGNGAKVEFWDDFWTNVPSLKKAFPRIYNIAVRKHSKVNEFGCFMNDSAVCIGNVEDRLSWQRSSDGLYTPKSFCVLKSCDGLEEDWFWKLTWANLASPKVEIFVRRDVKQRISVFSELLKRNVSGVHWDAMLVFPANVKMLLEICCVQKFRRKKRLSLTIAVIVLSAFLKPRSLELAFGCALMLFVAAVSSIRRGGPNVHVRANRLMQNAAKFAAFLGFDVCAWGIFSMLPG